MSRGVKGAKVRGAVNCVEESHIHGIEQIESFSHSFHTQSLGGFESTGQPKIDRLIAVAFESVPRLDPYTIVIAEDVPVSIEPGELGEVVGGFQRDDRTDMEISEERIDMSRSVKRAVQDKPLPDVIG